MTYQQLKNLVLALGYGAKKFCAPRYELMNDPGRDEDYELANLNKKLDFFKEQTQSYARRYKSSPNSPKRMSRRATKKSAEVIERIEGLKGLLNNLEDEWKSDHPRPIHKKHVIQIKNHDKKTSVHELEDHLHKLEAKFKKMPKTLDHRTVAVKKKIKELKEKIKKEKARS